MNCTIFPLSSVELEAGFMLSSRFLTTLVFPVDNVGAPFCHEIGHLGLKIRKIFACGAKNYRLAALAGK